MKDIVAGCKAVLVNCMDQNKGIIVNVICKVHKFKDGCDLRDKCGQRWEVDRYLQTNHGDIVNHVGEKQLKRIDNYDGNQKISWEEMQGLWVPDGVLIE